MSTSKLNWYIVSTNSKYFGPTKYCLKAFTAKDAVTCVKTHEQEIQILAVRCVDHAVHDKEHTFLSHHDEAAHFEELAKAQRES